MFLSLGVVVCYNKHTDVQLAERMSHASLLEPYLGSWIQALVHRSMILAAAACLIQALWELKGSAPTN